MTALRTGHIAAVLLGLAVLALAGACGDSTAPATERMPRDTTPSDSMATDGVVALTDADIVAWAGYDSTWTWWEFSDSLLDRTGNSPHADRIRVRYNAAAATQLDSTGRLVAEPDFPDSAIVVKEVFSDDGTPVEMLVMFKRAGDPHASHGDWLWGEYDAATEAAIHSVGDDSGYCHNCHVQGVDHMRMPDSH